MKKAKKDCIMGVWETVRFLSFQNKSRLFVTFHNNTRGDVSVCNKTMVLPFISIEVLFPALRFIASNWRNWTKISCDTVPGGNSHMKQTGKLVVSLRGLNFGWLVSLKGVQDKKPIFWAIKASFRAAYEEINKEKNKLYFLTECFFRGHKKLKQHPNWSVWGSNSNFITSIPVCVISGWPHGNTVTSHQRNEKQTNGKPSRYRY